MTGQARESCFLPEAHKPHSRLPKLQLALGDVIHREALGVNSHSWAALDSCSWPDGSRLVLLQFPRPCTRMRTHSASLFRAWVQCLVSFMGDGFLFSEIICVCDLRQGFSL